MISLGERYLFHVHTFRCGHVEMVSDEEYIKKAIGLRATDICFTDHAPFPGNPFGGRMKYEELPEYISTLKNLKEQYQRKIKIHIGLEIEYFSRYDQSGYYQELSNNPDLEILLLGQHMAEDPEDREHYTFEWPKERLQVDEYTVLGDAMIAGMKTGCFKIVAHPDRIFRRQKIWTPEMEAVAVRVIDAAVKYGLPLEKNCSSMRHKHHYWKEFWEIAEVNGVETVIGLDAHKLKRLELPDFQ